MPVPSTTSAQVAEALQRCFDLAPDKALDLTMANATHIRSPWNIPGMAPLVERLSLALQRREPLMLFGDFDADGVTGCAVLYRTLVAYSDTIRRYTPFCQEGYGLHISQVEQFAQRGIRVIVTVDSGVSSYEAVARAQQLGLEVLVTDHHLPRPDRGPAGTLAINPPDYLLSGAQLAYMVSWALRERMEGKPEHDPWGLALSAVGAQADWVPVDLPETRAWVAEGQAAINGPDCPSGLRALRALLGESYTGSELRSLWGLLNMGKRSRLIDPNTVVEALLPDTPPERATECFQGLIRERTRTYSAAEVIAAATLDELRPQVGKAGLLIHEIHVGDETLSEVEGPLTSRIVEMTGRPAIVLRQSEGQINFSGRARGKFSFESFLSDPEFYALTLAMGGHRQAIGGSIRPQDRGAFVDAIRRWEQRQLPVEAASVPVPPPVLLPQLDPTTAYLHARAIGPFGHRLRPPRFRTTIVVRGGWAFSGDFLVDLARPLGPGKWEVTFRFNEAACDGENVAIRVEGALHE